MTHRITERMLQFRSMLLVATVALVGCLLSHLISISYGASTDGSPPVAISQIRSGLNGVWKVGFETQHRVQLRANQDLDIRLELRTVDGEGVAVTYQSDAWRFGVAAGEERLVHLHAKHGRDQHPITVRILDSNSDAVYLEHSLTAKERGESLPSYKPWVLGIGKEGMGLDSAILRSARVAPARNGNASLSAGASGDYVVTELTHADDLPLSLHSFEGVDLLVFSSSNHELVRDASAEQAAAIRDWVLQGGRCLLTIGENGQAWFDRSEFSALVPGPLESVAKNCNPGPLESFLNSESPLQPIASAIVSLNATTYELRGLQSDRTPYPLMAKWTAGFGKVKWFATEIDSTEVKAWESQTALIKLIMSEPWEGRGAHAKSLANAEDLAVQLTSALDRFDGLKVGNLTQMSVLLAVLLAILGPFDYFIIAKRWKRPRATWLTLAVAVLLSCGFIAYLQKEWKPTQSQLNSVEVIDIDSSSGRISGRGFAHLYGGPRGEYSLAPFPTTLHGNSSSLEAASAPTNDGRLSLNVDPIRLDWMGQPGKGLGGFESSVATDRVLPPYMIQRSTDLVSFDRSREDSTASSGQLSSGQLSTGQLPSGRIYRLGIPEAGTKAIEYSWTGSLGISGQAESSLNEAPFGQLKSVSGAIDLLNGFITNPITEDINNAILIYRGRFYSLPLKLRPGEQVSFSVTDAPRDFTRRLQKRVIIDGKDAGTPWDRNEGNLNRIVEILAFHRAAGGGSYTSMIHRYLSSLDQSEILRTERAILFGELSSPQVDWEIDRNGAPISVTNGSKTSLVRILIPVDPPANSGGSLSMRQDR